MIANRKKDYLWNTIAGLINAAEAVVMSMVVTRFGTLSDAGILSLAFAVGNVLMTIGKFGVRVYQVTDAKKQYSFHMYLIQRIITIFLMFLSMVGFLVYGRYAFDKRETIILIAFIYMVESLEDCFWGSYQSIDMLYIGAQMFSVRWIAILGVFISCMIITGKLPFSLACSAFAGLMVFLIWIIVLRNEKRTREQISGDENSETIDYTNWKWLSRLFYNTFPLFLASFCSIFISNIPKFAIDRHLNDEVQACYGFVAMPVFVIGLLNQFIYQPTVVKLTIEYNEGRLDRFRWNVRKQVAIVTGISTVCVVGAGMVGVPVLSLIYHTDLKGYWRELIVLQFAGGFLALSGYFNVLLTLMRRQGIILVGYVMTLIIGIVLLKYAVIWGGTLGASIGYLLLMVALFIFYLIAYYRIIGNRKRKTSASTTVS